MARITIASLQSEIAALKAENHTLRAQLAEQAKRVAPRVDYAALRAQRAQIIREHFAGCTSVTAEQIAAYTQ